MGLDLENQPAFTELPPLNDAMAGLLVDLVRESWHAGELRVEFGENDEVTQRVVNPDTNEEKSISDDLAAQVAKLDEHRRNFGFPWKTALYGARYNEESGWKITATLQ